MNPQEIYPSRPPTRLIKREKECSLCKKTGLNFYLYNLSWCVDCARKKSRIKSIKYWNKNKLESNKHSLENYYKHRKSYRLQYKKRWEEIKKRIFEKYGGYQCICCKETNPYFLTMDHINGGGTKHRKSLKGGGMYLYRWILKNNFPPGFQIMCMNCNFGKGQNFRKNGINKCPHEN